jgi:N,N-dimethylformamidase beta subunit-like, C-terminal
VLLLLVIVLAHAPTGAPATTQTPAKVRTTGIAQQTRIRRLMTTIAERLRAQASANAPLSATTERTPGQTVSLNAARVAARKRGPASARSSRATRRAEASINAQTATAAQPAAAGQTPIREPAPAATQSPPPAGTPSPIVVENATPGTPDWEISTPALAREIEGYASRTSVNRGDSIDLFVSTRDARYTIDVFRMGWYGGAGARRVAGPIDRAGILQDVPAPAPVTRLIECRWREPYSLETRDASGPWPSGVYLARLTAHPSNNQSFIVFVVRDDEREAAIAFQSSVATFAAYNNWGGASLYAFNSGNKPARKVSFDRPYATNPYGVRLDGAGDFLRRWEYNAVRFLERNGYDVTYLTDVDTHERRDALARHRIALSVGHDEYWSRPMREHFEAARDRGTHLAFLGAGNSLWQIRFEPSSSGVENRTIVAYKEAADTEDPLAIDRDPHNNRLVTSRWRDKPVSRSEDRLMGVMYAADPVDGNLVIDEASHWAFAGTSVKRGDVLTGLLGYEVDAIYDYQPDGLTRLAHSPFVDQGQTRYADATIHTAESGALVFATGSMQWNWGLDGYNAPQWHPLRVNETAQRVTRNILDRMVAGRGRPVEKRSSWSSYIVFIAVGLAAMYVLRAWISSRMAS